MRLRRHGLRPLVFQGALLIKVGEPEGPQISLYEIADGDLAVAIMLPGFYCDAWRLDSIESVAEFVNNFDADARVGFSSEAELQRAVIVAEPDSPTHVMGPAYRRVVDTFIRVSNNPY